MEKFADLLEEGDIKTAIAGETGTDIKLSPAAQRVFPYAVEAKRAEKVSLRQWWNQAQQNSTDKLAPLLITKQNRQETLVVMNWETFMKLL